MPSELGMAVGERRPLNKGWKDIMHVMQAAAWMWTADEKDRGKRQGLPGVN